MAQENYSPPKDKETLDISEKTPRFFQPGVNPTLLPGYRKPGPRKVPRDLSKLARTYTVEALEETVEIMRKSTKDSDKLKAIDIILERGYGKAPLKIDLGVDVETEKANAFLERFSAAAKSAHESLSTVPALPAPDSLQEKSQLSDKGKLANAVAVAAGITVIESEEFSPQSRDLV